MVVRVSLLLCGCWPAAFAEDCIASSLMKPPLRINFDCSLSAAYIGGIGGMCPPSCPNEGWEGYDHKRASSL